MIKTLTLASAVQEAIASFTKQKLNFSAYDATRRIRAQVNSGALELIDVARSLIPWVGLTFEVPHSEVRDIVLDLSAQGELPDYQGIPNGNFVLYTYLNGQQPQSSTFPFVTQAAPLAPPFLSFTTVGSLDHAIKTYVTRKHSTSEYPSLKELQSTLRRRGNFTCRYLKDKSQALGFKVTGPQDQYSKHYIFPKQ